MIAEFDAFIAAEAMPSAWLPDKMTLQPGPKWVGNAIEEAIKAYDNANVQEGDGVNWTGFWKWADGQNDHAEALGMLEGLHKLLQLMRISGMNKDEFSASSGVMLDQLDLDSAGLSQAMLWQIVMTVDMNR